jgi:hypothetical protein
VSETYGDLVAAALHADAEAARDEIRSEGLICPSCGKNWADLIGRHCLIMVMPDRSWKPIAECRDGRPAECKTWREVQAAVNISVADEVWRQETIMFDRDFIGSGPGEFTGLLSILERP